jgi:DNA polymerase III alpha subunit
MRNFVPFHCHIASFDAASTAEKFAKREVELGTGHITITDHGTLAGTRQVYDLVKKTPEYAGLTPILGLEAYFRDDDDPLLIEAGVPKDANGTFKSYLKYSHFTMHFMDQQAFSAVVQLG